MTTEIQKSGGDRKAATKQKMCDFECELRIVDAGGGDALPNSSCQDNMTDDCSTTNNENNNSNEEELTQTKLHLIKHKTISSGKCIQRNSEAEDGFLSTSPDSANEEPILKSGQLNEIVSTQSLVSSPGIYECSNPKDCVSVQNILESFKAPLSQEQAWALIFQTISVYRRIAAAGKRRVFNDLEIPDTGKNLNLHPDGTVHCSWTDAERQQKEQKLRQQLQRQQQQQDKCEGKFIRHPCIHIQISFLRFIIL